MPSPLRYSGDHNELLVFKFEGFKVGRFVSVTVLDFSSENRLARGSRCDTTQYRRRHFGSDTWIIPGEKLWNQNKHIFDKLEKYFIPKKLWHSLENNWSLDDAFPELTQPLSKANYRNKFHCLLYLEECVNQINVRKYDMSDVTLRRENRYFVINVPGLADGRPSLILGDKVIAFGEKRATDEKTLGFEGFIHEVIPFRLYFCYKGSVVQIRRDEILVRFNDQLNDFRNGVFKIMFQTGR